MTFTHLDEQHHPHMVDVSAKGSTLRRAVACGSIRLASETVRRIEENTIRKGNVLITAELAGIQAAKKTSDLIPLCHPIMLTSVKVSAVLSADGVEVTATVCCTGPTGVEMEALTAVSTALLTVYDMCKAVDTSMVLEKVHLVEKTKTALT